MVAGFAEVIEGKDLFGCGGLQPSEFVGYSIRSRADSHCSAVAPTYSLAQSQPTDEGADATSHEKAPDSEVGTVP
jgi:hypothetical protein